MAGALWQRCRTHYVATRLTKVPKSSGSMVATTVRTILAQPDPDQVWPSTIVSSATSPKLDSLMLPITLIRP